MFNELITILLLALDLQIDLPKDNSRIKELKNLTAISAKKIRNAIKPFTSEKMAVLQVVPEVLYSHLHFIQIPNIKNQNIESIEGCNSNLIKVLDSEYLDVDSLEFFSKRSFKDLIKEKRQLGLPFILALVTSEKDGHFLHTCYDAITFNYYFTHCSIEESNNIFKDPSLILSEPINSLPIKSENISYFVIFKSKQSEAKFLGTDGDLQEGPKSQLMNTLFSACKSNIEAQNYIKNLRFYLGIQEKHKVAQYCIGQALETGDEHALRQYAAGQDLENREQAKKYFLLSANQNFAPAHLALYKIYKKEKNIKKAYDHLECAADLGLKEAQSILGTHYCDNEHDIEKAKYYLNLAACQGDIDANRDLGFIYQQEYCYNNDEASKAKAKNHYAFAAKHSDAFSQTELAHMFDNEGSKKEQIEYLTLAAERNDIDAQYELWNIYKEENNTELANHYRSIIVTELLASANHGSFYAQEELIKIYKSENNEEEVKHFENLLIENLNKIANDSRKNEAQITLAQIKLHDLYRKRTKESLILIKDAAEKGNLDAQLNMAFLFQKKKKVDQAIYYYELAAKQNNSDAEYKLAHIYADFNDIEKAISYCNRAIQHGDISMKLEAQQFLHRLNNAK